MRSGLRACYLLGTVLRGTVLRGTVLRGTVLLGMVLLGTVFLVAACTGVDDPGPEPTRITGSTGPPRTTTEADSEQVQVIAHPDDDLYFMSPDVSRFIRHGWGSTTIVVTAGEYNGIATLTREQYAGTRQDGLRAAYADMVGVANVWNRAAVLVGGKQVERDVLADKPRVALVFLNLPEGKDSLPGRTRAVENLWKGAYANVLTLVPTGSAVDRVQTYTAEDLTRVLTALYGTASVTMARTLDSHPDHRFDVDHTDHIHVALFADKALSAYTSASGAAVTSVSYRGYGAIGLPANLDPASAEDKQRVLSAYAAHDPGAGLTGVGQPRVPRMYTRYLGPAIRSIHQADGRLAFAAVISGSIRLWTVDQSSRWDPVVLDGARVAPAFAVVRQVNGRLRFFALRLDDFHIVTAEQTAPNSDGFTGWLDLGNREPARPQDTGGPEAAVDGSGRVHLFVKDYAGGVSARSVSAAGTWSGWETLGGAGVTESLTAAVDAQGRAQLYAATSAGILWWTQPLAGAPLAKQPGVLGSVPAGRLTAVLNSDRRPQIFYRDATSGGVRTIRQTSDDAWSGPLELTADLTGPGEPSSGTGPRTGSGPGAMFGPVAATVSAGRIVLVGQSATHDLCALHQSASGGPFGDSWRDLPGAVANPAAVDVDGSGRLVLGAVGAAGTLRVRTERAPDDWTAT